MLQLNYHVGNQILWYYTKYRYRMITFLSVIICKMIIKPRPKILYNINFVKTKSYTTLKKEKQKNFIKYIYDNQCPFNMHVDNRHSIDLE